ncbi:hypothetical protein GCM10011326_22900 [Salipiger profundus]|nr:hypothetical protein GCM10011326_22900 [Salipiger profundus]
MIKIHGTGVSGLLSLCQIAFERLDNTDGIANIDDQHVVLMQKAVGAAATGQLDRHAISVGKGRDLGYSFRIDAIEDAGDIEIEPPRIKGDGKLSTFRAINPPSQIRGHIENETREIIMFARPEHDTLGKADAR